MKKNSGARTLLASVILSSPGPIVVGVGLLLGHSSTQLTDFIRRTAELAAIIVSWIMFRILHQNTQPDIIRKAKLEHAANLCVGLAMCLSGTVMIFVTLLMPYTEKGNVIPGLVIAVLGVTTNSWFWLRYRKLHRLKPDAILAVQSRLYRAKSLVDLCVMLVLSTVVIAPSANATRYVDLVGSVIVAFYLVGNGLLTIRGKNTGSTNINSFQS